MRRALLACTLFLAASASGASFRVGTFTKSTAGAPVSQVITHNLGVTPKALILWTVGATNQSFRSSYYFSWGATDGSASYSMSSAAADGANPSNSTRRFEAE